MLRSSVTGRRLPARARAQEPHELDHRPSDDLTHDSWIGHVPTLPMCGLPCFLTSAGYAALLAEQVCTLPHRVPAGEGHPARGRGQTPARTFGLGPLTLHIARARRATCYNRVRCLIRQVRSVGGAVRAS